MLPTFKRSNTLAMILLRRIQRVISLVVSMAMLKRPLSLNQQNVLVKFKMILIMTLVCITSSMFLSSLRLSAANYNNMVDASRDVTLYRKLNGALFQTKGFLRVMRATASSTLNSSTNRNLDHFHVNHSSTAYWSRLIEVYSNEKDPQLYMEQNRLPFHWADWVNTTPANPIINAYDTLVEEEFEGDDDLLFQEVNKICLNRIYDRARGPAQEFEPNVEKITVLDQLLEIGICSSIYQYYYQQLPDNIVFETEYNYFKWPVQKQRLEAPLGVDGLAKMYNRKGESQSLTKSEKVHFTEQSAENFRQAESLKEIVANASKGLNTDTISLQPYHNPSPEDFQMPSIDALIKEFKEKKNKTPSDERYLKFLRYSKDNVADANVFNFPYPQLHVDKDLQLHHYNYPWVKQMLSVKERSTVVHHLIRSWFKLCEQADVISWFNYGNLIGWYRYSRNLPWDTDVDVQLSIADLDKLGRHWNNSLVIENPKHGNGLFWLQTTPFYLQQNDEQFIDARYIDVKSGIYIDVSALWLSERDTPEKYRNEPREEVYNCKHYNWFPSSMLFPLRRTLYEGGQAYTIKNYSRFLLDQYGSISKTQMNNNQYNFQEDIGMWVPDEVCTRERAPVTEDRFDSAGELTLIGACNNTVILEEWRGSKKLHAIHKEEFKLLEAGQNASHLSEHDLSWFRQFDFTEYY